MPRGPWQTVNAGFAPAAAATLLGFVSGCEGAVGVVWRLYKLSGTINASSVTACSMRVSWDGVNQTAAGQAYTGALQGGGTIDVTNTNPDTQAVCTGYMPAGAALDPNGQMFAPFAGLVITIDVASAAGLCVLQAAPVFPHPGVVPFRNPGT